METLSQTFYPLVGQSLEWGPQDPPYWVERAFSEEKRNSHEQAVYTVQGINFDGFKFRE